MRSRYRHRTGTRTVFGALPRPQVSCPGRRFLAWFDWSHGRVAARLDAMLETAKMSRLNVPRILYKMSGSTGGARSKMTGKMTGAICLLTSGRTRPLRRCPKHADAAAPAWSRLAGLERASLHCGCEKEDDEELPRTRLKPCGARWNGRGLVIVTSTLGCLCRCKLKRECVLAGCAGGQVPDLSRVGRVRRRY